MVAIALRKSELAIKRDRVRVGVDHAEPRRPRLAMTPMDQSRDELAGGTATPRGRRGHDVLRQTETPPVDHTKSERGRLTFVVDRREGRRQWRDGFEDGGDSRRCAGPGGGSRIPVSHASVQVALIASPPAGFAAENGRFQHERFVDDVEAEALEDAVGLVTGERRQPENRRAIERRIEFALGLSSVAVKRPRALSAIAELARLV